MLHNYTSVNGQCAKSVYTVSYTTILSSWFELRLRHAVGEFPSSAADLLVMGRFILFILTFYSLILRLVRETHHRRGLSAY